MKIRASISRILLITIGIVALPSDEAEKVLAIGCDTYYRVTGQIAGCSDLSTENANEWLEKYSFCLQQQLSREISIYKSKAEIYYAELDKNSSSNIRFEDITLQDEAIAPLSLSQNRATTYLGNADFCN